LESELKIRAAHPLDNSNIVRLLKMAWEESRAVQVSRVNERKAQLYVAQILADERFCVRVAEISGRLVGSIALTPMQEPWSDDWFLVEEWFYVLPSFRARGTALHLLSEVEQMADQAGIPILYGVTAVQPQEIDHVFANRRGVTHMGGNFMRLPKASSDGKQEAHNENRPDESGAIRSQVAGVA